jgi:peptide/nickel transport system substrate-binding protein
MVYVNEKREFVPWLAKEWIVSDDGLIWTFKLQEGVQFHQGYGELTAEDVIWTHQEMGREDSRQSFRDHINRLWNLKEGGAKAVDKYTVEVNSGTLQADMLNVLSRIHTNIYSKKVNDELGDEGAFAAGVGTGPWEKDDIRVGEFWKLKAVENHWRKTPEFTELIVWQMPEESTRVANFKVGKVDTFDMALDSLPAVEEEEGAKFMRVLGGTGLGMTFFGNWYARWGTPEFEEKNPGYDASLPWVSSNPDINSEEWKNAAKVRRAMNIAIDRQSIVDTILRGEGAPLTMVGWSTQEHRLPDDIRYHEYNPDKAMQLLEEAGWPDGFSVEIRAPVGTGGAAGADAIQAVATMWEAIGIRARAETEVYVTLRPRIVGRIFKGVYFNGGVGRPDPIDLWPEVFLSTAGFSFGAEHPVLDDLLNKAIGIPQEAERYEVMIEAARFMYENDLASGLYIVNVVWPLGPRIDSWVERLNYSGPGDLTAFEWIPHRQ